uniref:ARMC9 CTLH-like domain-containing protein n=1 Tax=Aureoumbra lagunensis TaxID=44058 RepID=A0A7S3NHK2_9STRA
MAEPFEEIGNDDPVGETSELWAKQISSSVRQQKTGQEFSNTTKQEERKPYNSQQRRALDVADDMVLEYLAFRGFTETFRQLSLERVDDARNRGSFDARFAVEALLRSIRDLDGGRLLEGWEFLESKFFTQLDAELSAHADALRCGIFRYFCVCAVMRHEPNKAVTLLTELARRDSEDARGRKWWGNDSIEELQQDEERALWSLAAGDESATPTTDFFRRERDNKEKEEESCQEIFDYTGRNGRRWREWFAMPHLPEPHKDPVFRLYFSRQWQDDLLVALRNFLAAVFARAPPPKLLLLEKWHRSSAQRSLRGALLEAQEEQARLQANLKQAISARNALAKTLKSLIAHCHHENLRDANRLQRGGLFDDDPDDATRATRQAGAAALDLAKRCEAHANEEDHRDSDLLALCQAAESYLALLQGGGTSSTPDVDS